MFRFKVSRYKKGNISIGVLMILIIVVLDLIVVVTSANNMYRGAKVGEIKVYKDDRYKFEKSIKNDEIENRILSIINDFVKDVNMDEKSLREAFKKFVDTPIDGDEKYCLAYDKVYNEFFLYSIKNNERKIFKHYINDGKVGLKLKKI